MSIKPEARAKKRLAQERFLAIFAQTGKVNESLEAVGRTYPTFESWKKGEKWFRDRYLATKAARKRGEVYFSFEGFRKANFGMDTYWHQLRLVEALQHGAPGSTTMCLLPPEGGKTTTIEDWLCMEIALNPNIRICIISETQAHGRRMLRRIAQRMSDDALFATYITQYGPFKPDDRSQSKPWSADRIVVVKASHDERDPTVAVAGARTTIYGARYDIVILDDIQSVGHLAATDDLVRFYRQDVVTRVGPQGRKVIVGTRVGPGDFYEKMIEEELVDDLIMIPARDETGASYFPPAEFTDLTGAVRKVGWSEDALLKREFDVGADIWATVYMQQPSSVFGATFSEETIERAKDYDWLLGNVPFGTMTKIVTVDPAVAGNCSIKTLALSATTMTVIDTLNLEKPGMYTPIWDAIEEMCRRYAPQGVILEVNAFQAGLAREERLISMSRQFGFRIHEHTTGRNKLDSKVGIPAMADSMRRGEIVIPYGNDDTRRRVHLLENQLSRWRLDIPTRLLTQDEVMTLWFGWHYWKRMANTLATQQKWQTAALPWQDTASAFLPAGARG